MVLVVIALGIGVCRIVGDGDFFVSYSGVHLAFYHYNADGYYGQPGYKGVRLLMRRLRIRLMSSVLILEKVAAEGPALACPQPAI